MGAEQVDRRDEEGGRKGKEEWHWGLVKGSWRTLKKKSMEVAISVMICCHAKTEM